MASADSFFPPCELSLEREQSQESAGAGHESDQETIFASAVASLSSCVTRLNQAETEDEREEDEFEKATDDQPSPTMASAGSFFPPCELTLEREQIQESPIARDHLTAFYVMEPQRPENGNVFRFQFVGSSHESDHHRIMAAAAAYADAYAEEGDEFENSSAPEEFENDSDTTAKSDGMVGGSEDMSGSEDEWIEAEELQ